MDPRFHTLPGGEAAAWVAAYPCEPARRVGSAPHLPGDLFDSLVHDLETTGQQERRGKQLSKSGSLRA